MDADRLGLAPLRLEERGPWNPQDEYWGEKGAPVEAWAKPIIARGTRPAYEMEQVVPGTDPTDPDSDPIAQAMDSIHCGDLDAGFNALMKLCRSDLRCLDAHAHFGMLAFERRLSIATRHYEVGVRIGELTLGKGFDGVLPWGWLDNRPFLRCMHGFGLCLWRLKRFEDALNVFERMLWLNPSDNQGVRLMIDQVRQKKDWEDCRD